MKNLIIFVSIILIIAAALTGILAYTMPYSTLINNLILLPILMACLILELVCIHLYAKVERNHHATAL